MANNGKTRLLARQVGRQMTADEIESVGGAACCYAQATQGTSYNQEGVGTLPDSITYVYDYSCQWA